MPSRRATLFQVGSTAKSMTGTLAGSLVESGRIRWDTTVAEAFPGFAARMNPAYADVTLEQLLQHRGGIAALEGLEEILALPEFSGTNREQRQAFTEWALFSAACCPAGEFAYSNGGYAVAGAMLEAAANDTWENLIETRVLGRVGAKPTFGSPRLTDPDQPWGHLKTAVPSRRMTSAQKGTVFRPVSIRRGESIFPWQILRVMYRRICRDCAAAAGSFRHRRFPGCIPPSAAHSPVTRTAGSNSPER
jgi:CubicO group peptidase (beta-lactamase class C family)